MHTLHLVTLNPEDRWRVMREVVKLRDAAQAPRLSTTDVFKLIDAVLEGQPQLVAEAEDFGDLSDLAGVYATDWNPSDSATEFANKLTLAPEEPEPEVYGPAELALVMLHGSQGSWLHALNSAGLLYRLTGDEIWNEVITLFEDVFPLPDGMGVDHSIFER